MLQHHHLTPRKDQAGNRAREDIDVEEKKQLSDGFLLHPGITRARSKSFPEGELDQLFQNFGRKHGPPVSINNWIDKNLLLTTHPRCKEYIEVKKYDKNMIPINTVFEFESKYFKGKAIVRVIDTPTTELWYFKNRRRKTDVTIQGQFKKKLRFDQVYEGQIFNEKFLKVPARMLVNGILKVIKKMNPGLVYDIDSDKPYFISPLIASVQAIEVALPGQETQLPDEIIDDNMELQDPKLFVKNKFKSADRKKLFVSPEKCKLYYYEPKYVYTMSMYSHLIHYPSHELNCMGKWVIHKYVSQPTQANGVLRNIYDENCDDEKNSEKRGKKESPYDCECLWSFQIWNSKMVEELYPSYCSGLPDQFSRQNKEEKKKKRNSFFGRSKVK